MSHDRGPLTPAAIRLNCSCMTEVTRILHAIDQGDPHASDELLPLVYDELRKLAAQKLAHEKPGHTLQATALVHEAYLRLVATGDETTAAEQSWANRGHFFAAAAEAMRRILVESARRKQRDKHGGGRRRVQLEDRDAPAQPAADEILALDEDMVALDAALSRLAATDPEAEKVVKLHVFAGLPIEQVAEVIGISRATAYRQWSYARAWLRCAIDRDKDESPT